MNTLFKLPRRPYLLACSGGSDSIAALAFLRNGKHDFQLAYFNHGTPHGREALKFMTEASKKLRLTLHIGHISGNKSKKESLEEYYRRERYAFLTSFGRKIITAHHLNDCVETWLFSSINGKPKLIPYNTEICMRPFLTVTKEEMKDFASRNDMRWIEDPTNSENNIPRNSIRNEMMSLVKKVNPGIESTVKKMLKNKFKEDGLSDEI